MNNRGLLALESVDFQYPLLYKQLTAIFTKLAGSSATNDYIDASLAIHDAVQNATDMSVHNTFDPDGVGAYMMIPALTANHPLMNDSTYRLSNADGLTMIRKAKGNIKGGVDTKRNRVSGIFKDIILQIHFPMKEIKNEYFTPEECASIFLHELGHGFIYFLYLLRTATTNQVLAGIAKCLDGSDTYGNKQIILADVAKAVGLSAVSIDTLAAAQDRRVLNMIVITAMHKEYAKETGYDIYDATSNEALADQYATRMGAGRALVTGLDKMYRRYDNMAYRTTHAYLMIESVKVAAVVLTPYFIITGPAGYSALTSYLALLAFFTIVADATEFGMNGRYDMPGDRFTRVRSQLVEKLKNKNLSADECDSVQGDITVIDNLVSTVNDRRQFFGVLEDFLTAGRRFNRDMKLLQQSLEKLAANDLFVAAARLTVASKA